MDELALEILCNGIQRILNKFGYKNSIVAGGYVAGGNVLLSLSDTLFVNAIMIDAIRKAYQCQAYATAGVIMLRSPLIQCPALAVPVQTVDVLELINMHQKTIIFDGEFEAIEPLVLTACSER